MNTMFPSNAFDGLILALLLICVVAWPTQWISDRGNRALRIVAVSVIILQLMVDGPRPQLLPAYLVALVVGILLIANRDGGKATSIRESKARLVQKLARWTMVLGTGVFLLVSALLCALFPRFEYPIPSGPFALGTKDIRLLDPSRLELYTEDPDDHREVMVRVTYPAAFGQESNNVQRDRAHSDLGWILTMLVPNSVTPMWGAIPTHATVGAPIANAHAKYPVLIFSHGFPTGTPEQNTVLI
jgi:hypothetical protein